MGTFAVSVVLHDGPDPQELSTAFYDRFDGLLSRACHVARARVYWEAHSAVSAAQAVITELEANLGVRVARIDPELVTTREIAERVGRTPQAVSQWARGVRRQGQPDGFPAPYDVPGGSRVWRWGDVYRWLAEWMPDRVDPDRPLTSDEAAEVDSWLFQRARRTDVATDVLFAVSTGVLDRIPGRMYLHGGLELPAGVDLSLSWAARSYDLPIERYLYQAAARPPVKDPQVND